MASFVIHGLCSSTIYSPKLYKDKASSLITSAYLVPSNSFLQPKKQSLLPSLYNRVSRKRNSVVVAAQSNFLKVFQTVLKVGRDGIEAGTDLVPESVPRPIARISVTVAALAISLFVLKSFLSTAFFVLAMMGLVYFVYIALNKDQGPRGGGDSGGGGSNSTEDPLEEARRIMEKYK